MSTEQEQDQAFLKSFGLVMLLLAVIAVFSFFGARWISAVGEPQGPHPEEALLAQKRTDPVYRVITDASALEKVAMTGGAAASGGGMSGEEVFQAVCHTCHVPGLLGAPKTTDTAEWTKRLDEQGLQTLYENAVNGIGNMPPKGGMASLTKEEVHAAVDYILREAGVEGAPAAPSDTKSGSNDAATASVDTTAGDTAATSDDTAADEQATETASNDNATASATGGEQVAAASGAAIDAETANTVGKKVFKALCHTCHVPGIAGAPKVSDAAEWEKRLAEQGLDKLHYHAIHGLGAMPPKGGDPSLSDEEVIAAVNYMLLESGAKTTAAATPKTADGGDKTASNQSETDGGEKAAGTEAAADNAAAAGGQPAEKTTSDDKAAAGKKTASSGDGAGEKVAAASGAAIDAETANTVGKKVFKALCHTCHVPGIAGAPKVSDVAEWEKRLAEQGLDKLHYHAIHGLGAMPPKGGDPSLSDEEVIAAVNYMLLESGAK